MSLSTRPRSHAERDQIVAAISTYIRQPDADPILVDVEASLFAGVRAEYQMARASYQAAAGAADDASEAADAADAAFDRSFRRFVGDIRDEAGRSVPRVIADMMGGTLPGDLTSCNYREEAQRTRDLLVRVGARAGLAVDPTLFAALQDSVAALEAATDASEAATRAVHGAGAALTETVAVFDTLYGKLVRKWAALSEEGKTDTLLPRFLRADRKRAAADEA